MWHWLRDLRHRKILQTPFPPYWETILENNVTHYRRLYPEGCHQLQHLVQVFVAEKHWEGCGGLVLTDEIRVTIAAQACLMILALPHDLYRDVESIFVYPSTVMTPERRPGVFEISMSPTPTSIPILGQAQYKGPVILAWDSVKRTARHPESGHNVVYHEFAHKLDLLNGEANGTPPLSSPEEYRRWKEVCEREFLRLRAESKNGRHTFLDSYGATHESEFFAVVTEKFFDQPLDLLKHGPELYGVLKDFYRQDPAILVMPIPNQKRN